MSRIITNAPLLLIAIATGWESWRADELPFAQVGAAIGISILLDRRQPPGADGVRVL